MRTIDRIIKLIKDNNLTYSQFFEETGIKKATFDAARKRGTEFSKDNLDKVLTFFPDKKDYILGLDDQEETSANDYSTKYRPINQIHEDRGGKDIPFVDGEFFATVSPALQDLITLKKDTFVRIPMFSRGEFAIQVTGNSMKGHINHGDWIIIRKLNRLDKIIYGETYVIVSKYNDLRTIKFIKEDHDDDSILWLVPYNIEQFEPQSIEKTDILEIYLVIGSFKKIGN